MQSQECLTLLTKAVIISGHCHTCRSYRQTRGRQSCGKYQEGCSKPSTQVMSLENYCFLPDEPSLFQEFFKRCHQQWRICLSFNSPSQLHKSLSQLQLHKQSDPMWVVFVPGYVVGVQQWQCVSFRIGYHSMLCNADLQWDWFVNGSGRYFWKNYKQTWNGGLHGPLDQFNYCKNDSLWLPITSNHFSLLAVFICNLAGETWLERPTNEYDSQLSHFPQMKN